MTLTKTGRNAKKGGKQRLTKEFYRKRGIYRRSNARETPFSEGCGTGKRSSSGKKKGLISSSFN